MGPIPAKRCEWKDICSRENFCARMWGTSGGSSSLIWAETLAQQLLRVASHFQSQLANAIRTEAINKMKEKNQDMGSGANLQMRRLRFSSSWMGAFLLLAVASLTGCNAAKVVGTTPAPSPASVGTLLASSSSLDFGNVAVGNSKSMPLTVSNNGSQSATLQISQINVAGSVFHTSRVTLPMTLMAGQSAVVNVGFQPSAGGAASGSLSIVSTATDPTITVPLSGMGLAKGSLGVSPASMSFGNINVGSSQSQTGTLTAASSIVTVSSASWSGSGFSVSGITFPATISAGQSVPFTVTFAPQASGSATGTISFLSNATNSSSNESWSGTGIQGTQHSVALSWTPDPSAAQGYFVYRGVQTGGPYNKISTLQPAATYTDATVVSAQTYFYVVTAVGSNSVESGFSNEAVATIP
jgi:hypothetical protein